MSLLKDVLQQTQKTDRGRVKSVSVLESGVTVRGTLMPHTHDVYNEALSLKKYALLASP